MNSRHDEMQWRQQVAEQARQREALAWRPLEREGLARWKRRRRVRRVRRVLRNVAALGVAWASMGALAVAVYLTVKG